MTDFSPLDSALYESTPENIAASLRSLRKADAVMAALMPLSASTPTPPAAVPAGYVSMPVGRVQHVIDLLAERAHLNNARSPAHNARLLLEATLTTAKENGNG